MAFRIAMAFIASKAAAGTLATALPKASIAHRGSALLFRQAASPVSLSASFANLHHAIPATRSLFTSPTCFALNDALKAEIDYETKSYTPPEELAGGPPEPWTLTELKGDTHIALERTLNNETITVDMLIDNEEDEDENDMYTDEAGEVQVDDDVGITFNATVTKGDQALVFECRSDGDYLHIEHVSLEPANEEPSESAYTGPVFGELDDELQQEFQNYLQERGVDPELGAYLVVLANDKEQREYVGWLENVNKFVSQ